MEETKKIEEIIDIEEEVDRMVYDDGTLIPLSKIS